MPGSPKAVISSFDQKIKYGDYLLNFINLKKSIDFNKNWQFY
jgi:hypothetical protein